MNTAELNIFVMSFGIILGQHHEDQSDLVGTVFQVCAETMAGKRFLHNHKFCSIAVVGNGELDPYQAADALHQDLNDAESLANTIRNAVKNGRILNMKHWTETEPVYGTMEWLIQKYGQPEWLAVAE